MLALQELTAWEERLLQHLAARRGLFEELDEAWKQSGLYAEYGRVLSSYVNLADAGDDPADRLEALKRAIFLLWYETAEPQELSGLSGLPESAVQRTLELLDQLCRHGELDAELHWMLPWYHNVAPWGLLRVAGLACLETFLDQSAADWNAWENQRLSSHGFEHRGQMGRYWGSMRSAP